jgi:hypothetical protein
MTRARIAAALAAALLIAGCTSKPAPTQPDPSPSSPAGHGNLADCLRANGVPESAGPAAVLGPPAGVDPATWDRAMQACSALAPGPGPAGP